MAFSESDIPSLLGKVVIVTGGNSGIGKQTVAVLASKGAKVYLGARSRDKFEEAVADICSSHAATNTTLSLRSQIEFLKVDLSSAVGAKLAAEEFTSKEKQLHILYNNAGVMGTANGKLSTDGYEYQWAVNVFGPFVFTHHLLPTLLETAASSPKGSVRIINVASDGAKQAPKCGIPLDDPTVGSSTASRFQCYGHSKVGIILLTRQLAERYPAIVSLAPHPGPVQSNLTRELGIPSPIMWVLNRVVFKPVQYGALTQLYAGTWPSIPADKNGSYLVPLALKIVAGADDPPPDSKLEHRLPHPQCSDDAFGRRVWEWNVAAMEKAGAA